MYVSLDEQAGPVMLHTVTIIALTPLQHTPGAIPLERIIVGG